MINQTRKQGLPQTQLHNVFQAIILSRIQYAFPARYGYASKTHIESIQKMLVKAKRWHIVNKDFGVVDLFDDSDRSLFNAVQSCNHHLFAAKTEHTNSMCLLPKGHNCASLT